MPIMRKMKYTLKINFIKMEPLKIEERIKQLKKNGKNGMTLIHTAE